MLTPQMVPGLVATGASCRRETDRPKSFEVGDRVRMKNIHPMGHTRLPRYVRGRVGVIDRYQGVFVFPDTEAHHKGENAQHVYSVRFTAKELWGEDAPENQALYIDIWDDYMDKA